MTSTADGNNFPARVYAYSLRLIRFLVSLPNDPVLFEIKRQLTRSGTSIAANYFEAKSGCSKREYIQFFSHSLKSANESKFWLALLRDSQLLRSATSAECNLLFVETCELAKILAASILTMKGKREKNKD
jgi:four helix bundle protein